MNKRNYEFFGLSGVGKSFLLKKLINNLELDKRYKAKIFNYKSLLYWDLYKKKKINYFSFYLLDNFIFYDQYKDINFFISFFANIFRYVYLKLFNQKINIKISFNKKERESFWPFYKKYLKQAKKIKNKEIAKWLILDIYSFYLLKNSYKKFLLIDSEGIIQRILSLYQRINIKHSELNQLIRLCPKPKKIFFIKKKLNKSNNLHLKKVDDIINLCKEFNIEIININYNYNNWNKEILKIKNNLK
jgi:hypothetical protein